MRFIVKSKQGKSVAYYLSTCQLVNLSTYIRHVLMAIVISIPLSAYAQVGEHRDDLTVGVNAGYVLSSVGFTPKVSQYQHGGLTGGFTAKYVCEKYFNSICSVMAELNFASMGWKERILDPKDEKVINATTGVPEEYSRTINYIQIPMFAHLAWGKEQKGAQFFFHAGPQFGLYLGESTKSNFNVETVNLTDRSNKTIAQDTMSVERKFDYGIAAGMGMEYTMPGVGHFLIEGRYYYGLGNIYNATKRDYFAKSNHGAIIIKLAYLFDVKKTKR